MKLKTRIAPTPSGYLHIGNALSFLLTWLIARRQGGVVHLRIDDIDSERVRPEYREDIYESLAWLGLDWDTEARTQLGRQGHYLSYLQASEDIHLAYPCDCSRKTIQENTHDGLYGQTCLLKNQHIPSYTQGFAWRLQVAQDAEVCVKDILRGTCLQSPAKCAGDMIIWRKTAEPSYQLASVVDDMEAGINFIVRGMDLWNSTVFQLHLAERLGLSAFSEVQFLHHGLLLDEVGKKLSKSEGATSLRALRRQGLLPTHIYSEFADFWRLEIRNVQSLAELLEKLPDAVCPKML